MLPVLNYGKLLELKRAATHTTKNHVTSRRVGGFAEPNQSLPPNRPHQSLYYLQVDHEITGTIIADIAQLTQDTRHVDTAARRRALTVTTPT